MTRRSTVLLVEDDPDLTRFADIALRLAGYHAVTVSDGEAAVAAARRIHPDMVLLDLRLPLLDGWQVLAALQGEPELAAVPVVILSASADPRDHERARTARIAGWVQKPLTANRLLDVVEQTLAAAPVARG
ncbi:MAG TPA: response regulator [Chloroflexota bacterium]|jgi:CheY-like chemotaxis protein